MVKFLVYNQDHWMDSLTQKQIDDKGLQVKYNRRYQRGDFIEVRKDGSKMCGLEPNSFALINVPISISEAKQYLISRYEEITREVDRPKLDYLEDKKVKIFKYDSTIIEEYKVPTEIPDIGTADIDWVKLRGIVDRVDRRRKYRLNMSGIILDVNKEVTLTLPQFNSLRVMK